MPSVLSHAAYEMNHTQTALDVEVEQVPLVDSQQQKWEQEFVLLASQIELTTLQLAAQRHVPTAPATLAARFPAIFVVEKDEVAEPTETLAVEDEALGVEWRAARKEEDCAPASS